LAYWGPNNAQHQINSKYDTGELAELTVYLLPYDAEYCEDVTDLEQNSLEQKGNEWLPLGPKHQHHTSCFIEYDLRKCNWCYFYFI